MKIAYKSQTLRGSRLKQVSQANDIIRTYLDDGLRLTIRQLYYQFVARGLIENTVKSYKRLADVINEGRLQGLIDWDAIEDRTRALASLSHWSSPASIVSACATQFRLDLWANQDYRIEIWIEKEALAGVVERVAEQNRVPYLSCRGYTSQSEMHGAAMRLKYFVETGNQDVVILHLGDHDPSGIDMSRDIQDRLALFMGDAYDNLHFERLALNMNQVEEYQPPPNPAKTTDARYHGYSSEFGESSWELDALNPKVLVDLIDIAIAHYRDDERWETEVEKENTCRHQLGLVASNWIKVCKGLGK